MQVCHCVRFDEPVTVVEQAIPRVRHDEVRIKVLAAGIAYADALIVKGLYQLKPPLPFIPGNEFAGIVEEIGDGVSGISVGDSVMGMGVSVIAQQAVVPALSCYPIPKGMSDAVAGGFSISFLTALYALDSCGALKRGESVLVLGGAGAVGCAAIQVAKALGARVIAAASTSDKRRFCLDYGADAVVDYTQLDWRDDLKASVGEGGLQVVFDLVGGSVSEAALRSLSPGGRLLVVGFASGEIPRIALNLPLLKRSVIVGADFGGHALQQPDIVPPLFNRLSQLYANGRLRVPEPEVYPLSQVQDAMDKIMARDVRGKIVIAPQALVYPQEQKEGLLL